MYIHVNAIVITSFFIRKRSKPRRKRLPRLAAIPGRMKSELASEEDECVVEQVLYSCKMLTGLHMVATSLNPSLVDTLARSTTEQRHFTTTCPPPI